MKYLILTLLILLTFGCKPDNRSDDHSITAKEIASALQMQKWVIKMPEDAPASQRLALQLSVNNANEHHLLRLASHPGKNTTLLIWKNDEPDLFNYQSWSENGGMSGTIKDAAFIDTSTSLGLNSDKICSVGDTILEGLNMSNETYRVKIYLIEYKD